jgi:cytochrome P450
MRYALTTLQILDTTSEFIFGEVMGALSESHSCDEFMDAFAYAQKGTAIRATLRALKFLHRDKRWWEACKHITDFVDTHVDRALKQSDGRETDPDTKDEQRLRLLDEMARETQDRLTLRSMAINVFSPAHDGAAVALSNSIFHIARNPSIWAKLRKEIDVDTDRELTYDVLNSYKYLSWVLRESTSFHISLAFDMVKIADFFATAHRLTPIVTLTQRMCLEPTILPFGGGLEGKDPLYIPKGSLVELNYRAMCRDASFWGPDVDSFVPERWEHIRPGWEYTPFGGGPRVCPGQRLVFVESAYVLVMLLRRFKEVENRDPESEWKEEMRMTFQSKNGCLVGLIPE